MMRIAIVTPLSRGENLEKVMLSVLDGRYATGEAVPLMWYIIKDPTCTPVDPAVEAFVRSQQWVQMYTAQDQALAGHAHRNFVLNHLQITPDFWFYSLDDDNILHPDFIEEIALNSYECDVMVVDQILKDGTKRLTAAPENTKLNSIDTAQYTFRIRATDGLLFDPHRYDADGVFIESLYNKIPEKFKFINKDLCYYNYLR